MTESTIALIGSLSSDLFRVANLFQRGAEQGTQRFFQEARRWSLQLQDAPLPTYLSKIIQTVNSESTTIRTIEQAEQCLMFAVLLQNYCLHARSRA